MKLPLAGPSQAFRHKLHDLSTRWRHGGLPSRQGLETDLAGLAAWKNTNGVSGLWARAPLMLTATLDDGLGQGLALIRPVAEAAGLRVTHLGLLLNAESILTACRERRPAYLGLTVLQLDSEGDLSRIASQLPAETRLVAGGPAFAADPDLAGRCGVRLIARDMAHFIDLLLEETAQSASPVKTAGRSKPPQPVFR